MVQFPSNPFKAPSQFALVDSGASIHILTCHTFLSDASINHSAVASFAGSTSRATHKGTFAALVQCTNNKFHRLVQKDSALVVPDASRMLFSTPSQPLGPGLIHCELPSWGLHYVAEATVVDLLVGGVQVGASNFSNTFTFEPVWTAFSATTLRGAAGGDLVNISAAGLNASGSLERFYLVFGLSFFFKKEFNSSA